MLQTFVHYFLHFGFPVLLALMFYRNNWQRAALILLATNLVDLDHLLADPIFDPGRCSINFHPLHSYWATGIYFLLLFYRPLRLVGIGLLLHMGTDWLDCKWTEWV